MCEKDYICNPVACSCENGNYLPSIIDDSVTACDEIIDTTKTVPKNFNEKNNETKNLYILLTFFCFRAKRNHLLPYQVTNNKLKEVLY